VTYLLFGRRRSHLPRTRNAPDVTRLTLFSATAISVHALQMTTSRFSN